MALAVAGVVEGFYGPVWSWDDRCALARWCAERGLADWAYGPKLDARHRDRWREPYDADDLVGFERLAAVDGVRLWFGLSPGLSMDYGDAGDRAALLAKVRSVLDLGAFGLELGLDDIPPRPGLGADHAALCTWLVDQLGEEVPIWLVPTDYTSTRPTPHLDELAAGLPPSVLVGWTGPAVVCGEITPADARARADALGGRPPVLWDNLPVNDAFMVDRLRLGPVRGRSPALLAELGGWFANPMVQPWANLAPLASVAALLAGGDAEAAWAAEVGPPSARVLAEACDTDVPHRLVAGVAAAVDEPTWWEPVERLADWFADAGAVAVGDPALAAEVAPWVSQLRLEAAAGRWALAVLRSTRPWATFGPGGGRVARPDPHRVPLLDRWRAARRGEPVVCGARLASLPAFAQRPDGSFRAVAGWLEEDRNAVDALVRLALRVLERDDLALEVAVEVDGRAVEVAADGSFPCAPGAEVVLRAPSGATTRLFAP